MAGRSGEIFEHTSLIELRRIMRAQDLRMQPVNGERSGDRYVGPKAGLPTATIGNDTTEQTAFLRRKRYR